MFFSIEFLLIILIILVASIAGIDFSSSNMLIPLILLFLVFQGCNGFRERDFFCNGTRGII